MNQSIIDKLFHNTSDIYPLLFQVKILKHLVEHEKLDLSDEENLNIMSQYNAQCHQIRLAVSNIAEKVNVNTVVASQGRFEHLQRQRGSRTPTIRLLHLRLSLFTESGSYLKKKRRFVYPVKLYFVGGEWNYVIFSTVRSLPRYRIEKRPTLGWCAKSLGFISDAHQINVALTRARRGLIIIGWFFK